MATYTGLVIHQFKQKYPHVHSMADAGEVLLGPWGREIFGIAQILFFIFIMASHILTFGIMMNTITHHGACTIVFAVAALLLSIICTLPRTLKNVAYMSITSFISIGAAVIVTMVGVSITKPGMGAIHYTTDPSFHKGFAAVLNIIFAYAGHVAFFGFISELKDAKDFPKALCLLQVSDTSLYIVCAIVIYWFAGKDVKSPALDSAGPTIRKIAYGLAIPTVCISSHLHPYPLS
jgi:glucan phosphoethanolaminetransferase (alkaline phosphatase superfamily)